MINEIKLPTSNRQIKAFFVIDPNNTINGEEHQKPTTSIFFTIIFTFIIHYFSHDKKLGDNSPNYHPLNLRFFFTIILLFAERSVHLRKTR